MYEIVGVDKSVQLLNTDLRRKLIVNQIPCQILVFRQSHTEI